MRLLVTTEERFWQSGGHTWVQGPSRYQFWTRYLEAFDEVQVMGRVLPVDRIDPQWQQVDGDRVSVAPIPYYIGPSQYLLRWREVGQTIRAAADEADAYLLRAPGQLANRLWSMIRHRGRPYGIEVVGDPWDVFAPGAVTHPLAPLFRRWFTGQLRRQCWNAPAVTYITREVLQRRYPPGPHSFSNHYSDVELGPEAYTSASRTTFGQPPTLASVGSFGQMYKAPDVMIRAVARLHDQGRSLKLVLVGDGHYLEPMRELAASLGVAREVEFRGRLPAGDAVRAELDRADLFLLPSRAEALGRAMIEAMARGLPCIGSTIGGIPEYLPPEDLVPPGDHVALADKIVEFLDSPERMVKASARNLVTAAEYSEEMLCRQRTEFYRRIRYGNEPVKARKPTKMRLLVTTEARFWQNGGHIWVKGQSSHYDFWTRYLEVFDEVLVMGRVLPVDQVDPQWQRVDGDRVTVVPMPYYIGPWQYLLRRREMGPAVRAAAASADACLLRAPGQLATLLWSRCLRLGRPFGIEVVGDPWDVFAPGAVTHPLSPLFRRMFTRNLRRQCAGACAVAYVTRRALQARYPAAEAAFITNYSSIELKPEAFASAPRTDAPPDQPTLISVLSFGQMYKAPDVMIRALARLLGQGRRLKLVMIGDGLYLEPMRALAVSLGVEREVEFRGNLPAGGAVRDELDRADLFLLPSRMEGLPRAMIEAMARGLPCIGSTIGGIPELLPAEDLVPVGDDAALAVKIAEFLDHPDRMARASARNLRGAAEYRDDVLGRRRNEFYRRVRYATEYKDGDEIRALINPPAHE